jgi:hypothetical protein
MGPPETIAGCAESRTGAYLAARLDGQPGISSHVV